jgi:hypothetical protein
MKNLRKKYEYLRNQLDDDSDSDHTSSSDDSNESEEEEAKPQKKKAGPRAGVSAEVYGQWNKKSDFKAPIVAKSE